MAVRNLLPKRAPPRVVDASWSQQVAVGTQHELQPVAWAYAQCIEDMGRESDLVLCGDVERLLC